MWKPALTLEEAKKLTAFTGNFWSETKTELKGGFNCFMSLEEVAKVLEVTRERVRQIEMKAIKKLQHLKRSKNLKDYL